ncbi:MAG: methylenetetrahydrofolate reductase C-terminal domain-containing protein [Elusimicrobiota bacterium]
MIVGERKSFEEIKEKIKGYEKILLVGCGTCVTVCHSGGEKEVGILAEELRLAALAESKKLEILEATVERQCEPEFCEKIKNQIEQAQAVFSMACGCGVGLISEIYADKRVYPLLNTTFYGVVSEQGVFKEYCGGCGNCVLDLTAGICPIVRCSKSLLNGPCGGSTNGKCEVDPDNIDCAWQKIYDQLTKLKMPEKLSQIIPPKDWRTEHGRGPRKMVREDLKI